MPHSAHLWSCSSHTGLPVHPWVCQAPPTWALEATGSFLVPLSPFSRSPTPAPRLGVRPHHLTEPRSPCSFPHSTYPSLKSHCHLLAPVRSVPPHQGPDFDFLAQRAAPGPRTMLAAREAFSRAFVGWMNEYQGKDISVCKQLPWLSTTHRSGYLVLTALGAVYPLHGDGSCEWKRKTDLPEITQLADGQTGNHQTHHLKLVQPDAQVHLSLCCACCGTKSNEAVGRLPVWKDAAGVAKQQIVIGLFFKRKRRVMP